VATTSRRLKLLRLTDYLEFKYIKQVLMAVPDDVKFMSVGYDLLTASHIIILEHESFPEVFEGDQIPAFVVTLHSSDIEAMKNRCTCVPHSVWGGDFEEN